MNTRIWKHDTGESDFVSICFFTNAQFNELTLKIANETATPLEQHLYEKAEIMTHSEKRVLRKVMRAIESDVLNKPLDGENASKEQTIAQLLTETSEELKAFLNQSRTTGERREKLEALVTKLDSFQL